jgi:hypothetical protein
MFCCANQVNGFSVLALGKKVGKVKDFLFDDLSWIIRYLLVDTNERISINQVLLLMLSVAEIDWENQIVPVNLTIEDLIKSPQVEAHLPVSRQKELEIYNYFGRMPYWGAGFSLGAQAVADMVTSQNERLLNEPSTEKSDSNLRTLQEVTGYKLTNGDEMIGKVSDFFVESSNWIIRYLIIDMNNQKQTLFSPQWVSDISWRTQEMRTRLTRDQIYSAPIYDSNYMITRQYEEKLYQHFNQQGYWL